MEIWSVLHDSIMNCDICMKYHQTEMMTPTTRILCLPYYVKLQFRWTAGNVHIGDLQR